MAPIPASQCDLHSATLAAQSWGEPSLVAAVCRHGVGQVTSGKEHYGPQGSYHAFAGRACTRGVALPSLELKDISDDISDFDQKLLDSRQYWEDFLTKKYPQASHALRRAHPVPRATDGGNKHDSVCHWEASVAVWRSHCEAGIGVITSIPYYQKYCFLLHVDHRSPSFLALPARAHELPSLAR